MMTPEERKVRRKEVRERCYRKHRDRNLAYAAEYRKRNGQKIAEWRAEHNAEYVRSYRERRPEKARTMSQAWKDANPERRKATKAAYQKRMLHRHRTHQHNRRARKIAVGGSLSPELAQHLYARQGCRCACCGAPLNNAYEMDHIVPLALGGSNTDDNMQLLTSRCNRQKGARDPIAFMQSRGLLL